jgi:hypothetical protein
MAEALSPERMAETRHALRQAAASADLHKLYQTWSGVYVPDSEMEPLEVRCTVGDILKWADEARASLLGALSDDPAGLPLEMNARELVRLQARYLDFLGEMAGWRIRATLPA